MSLSSTPRSRAPRHQNHFAFKHNKGSKKTAKILRISHHGLCNKCNEKIEWRKKFRKYKPVKQPKKCQDCTELKVTRAYHILCQNCSEVKHCCAICKASHSDANDDDQTEARDRRASPAEVEVYIGTLREREKRSLVRNIDNKKIMILKAKNGDLYEYNVDEESDSEDEASEEDQEKFQEEMALEEDDF